MHTLPFVFLVIGLAACGGTSTPPSSPDDGTGAAAPSEPSEPTGAPTAGACIKTGCSSTVCTEPGNEMMTTCEFKPEYACYQKATCERQADGKCGWTESPELAACLQNPPPM